MFFESIAYNNYTAPLLPLHLERMKKTLTKFSANNTNDEKQKKKLFFSYMPILKKVLSFVPHSPIMYKGRFTYNPEHPENGKMEFIPYQIKPITTLKIIKSNLNYSLKYCDRKEINALYQKKGNADDILIVKNGMITDSSYTNIVLSDGRNWITPSNTLIEGVMREHLIKEKVIQVKAITTKDLPYFKSFKLINALRHFNDLPAYPIDNILL